MPHLRRMGTFLSASLYGVLWVLLAGCGEEEPLFQGYVEADYRYLASPVSGHVMELVVQRGQSVEAGALLFRLDAEQEARALEQAQMELAVSRHRLADALKGEREPALEAHKAAVDAVAADLERLRLERIRQEELVARDASTVRDLDQARLGEERLAAQLRQVQAQLAEAELGSREDLVRALEAEVAARQAVVAVAQWRLEQATVKSPVAGIVEDLLYRPGEWVAAGRPVAVIFPPEEMRVYFFLSDAQLVHVQAGQELELDATGLEHPLRATVRAVSSEPEFTPPVIFSNDTRGKLLYRIEAGLSAEAAGILHPGQPVRIHIPKPSH